MSAVIDQSDEFSQRMSHGMNKFHTLLHRSKNITLLFSGDSALFAKNTRRWGCVDFEPSSFNFQLSTFPSAAQGLAESSRNPPAFKSANNVSAESREIAIPTFRSGVRTRRTVMRSLPAESGRIISPFVSVCCGVTALPFTSTRHAG